ncbi:MAG: FAD-dependent oxidoreductase, partial [Methylotenera sp.]|nr:FAD-dependent oxidoreductase [Methylotenera sp.]
MLLKTAIIIGGGIAGCATAHALAIRGIQVTLFERNATIANEASGNPQAMLYPRISGDDDASQFALA